MKKRNNLIKIMLVLCVGCLFPTCTTSYYNNPTPTISIPKENFISSTINLDGYWGEWRADYSCKIRVQGGYSGFIIYDASEGPWDYFFKFTISNYVEPDINTKLRNYQNKTWYEYKGNVEYYICDDYPTIYKAFKSAGQARFVSRTLESGRPTKKITSPATIKIEPYAPGGTPKVYNIWFDNVGFAIDLNDLKF